MKPQGECYKFGELPTYGPPVSPKLIKLIGPDRDEFLKGRRCENQGLGVGAFIYYRRVVENQKNRILGEIIKVSEKIGATEDKIKKLKSAVTETQFSKALDMAKDAMPESLLINGHSPILLLHSALSEGVRALSDEQCLELAGSVTVRAMLEQCDSAPWLHVAESLFGGACCAILFDLYEREKIYQWLVQAQFIYVMMGLEGSRHSKLPTVIPASRNLRCLPGDILVSDYFRRLPFKQRFQLRLHALGDEKSPHSLYETIVDSLCGRDTSMGRNRLLFGIKECFGVPQSR